MSLKTGTICSKHDKLMDLAKELSNYMDDVKREIEGMSDSIYDLADKCKEDGQRMENGLDNKRKTIDELEKRIDELESENESLKDDIKSLTRDISDLQSNQVEA